MKQKRYWVVLLITLIVIIVLVALGTFSEASTRENAAQNHLNSLVSELHPSQPPAVTSSNNICSNSDSGIVKLVFRHRSCTVSETEYYTMDGNLNDLKTSLYNSAIAKGWDILDNGRLDSYKFSSDDYLEASTNRDQKPSTLTIRLLPSEKINSMNELSPTEKSQLEQTASKSSYVIVVNVSTLFEG